MLAMNARRIRIANGMPGGGVGEDQARDRVQQAQIVVGGVEGVGDDDPRDHLA